MKRRHGSVLVLTAAAMAVTAAPAAAETVYGVTDAKNLVTFDSATPGTITGSVAITGLGNATIAGIDVRPATLQVTLLDSAGQLYTVDTASGAATAVGAPFTNGNGATDIDFNPTVDRLRIVGAAASNLRANPNTGGPGVTTDGALAFAGADANAGDVPDVQGAAYSNSFPASATFPNPPTTTLFDIEAGNDVLATQAPPNAGTLNTVGPLGVDVTGPAGFDIVTDADGTTNRAYAALETGAAAPGFYRVDTATGAATKVGDLPAGDKVRDIAVAPTVPLLIGLRERAGRQTLTAFAADRPQDAGEASVRITGLPTGVALEGIDQRPKDGQLYGLGSDSRIYTVNLLSGRAGAVGTGAFTPALDGTNFGFDFNPVADRIRVVSDTGQNLRINPDTGVGAVAPPSAADGTLTEGGVTATGVTAAAYTNSVKAPASTTLFDIQSTSDLLKLQDPPNAGTLTNVSATATALTAQADVPAVNGYDITPRFNQGFATATSGGPVLLSVNGAGDAGARANGTGAVVGPLGVAGPFTPEAYTGLATFDSALIPAAQAPATPAPTTPVPAPGTPANPSAAAPATPAAAAAAAGKVRTRVSLSVTRRDRRSPFRFKVTGRIVPKGTAPAGAFDGGRVRLNVKRAGRMKTIATRTLRVSPDGRVSGTVAVRASRLGKGTGRLTIRSLFGGTDALYASRGTDRATYR